MHSDNNKPNIKFNDDESKVNFHSQRVWTIQNQIRLVKKTYCYSIKGSITQVLEHYIHQLVIAVGEFLQFEWWSDIETAS